jgi:hypothetical protein
MLTSFSVLDMVHRIPLTARTVLFAGCGNGDLARLYRAMNPKATLLAVEPHPGAAEQAAEHCDHVVNAGLAVDPLPFDPPDGIDCIVYGQIDDLNDPWTVLARHSAALSAEGVVLLALPNREYWRLTERLLRGLPEPGDAAHLALQNAGHTQASAAAAFARIGLSVRDIAALDPDPEASQWFCNLLSPGLSALGIDTGDFASRSAASHWLCRAATHAAKPLIVAGNILKPIGGVYDARIVHPFQALAAEAGVRASVVDALEVKPPEDDSPRIFIIHRPSWFGPTGLDTLKKISAAGYLAVCEFDDHPDHFVMMQLGGDISFSGVHAIQTSTPAMAAALRQYNPEIAIFPNAIMSLPEIGNFADPSSLTFFFGALNRQADWQPLMPVINKVAGMAGSRLKFQVVHDQGFFDALETEHKTFTPISDYETYLNILGACEISFMPLGDTVFNRAKSDLKFIEAAACRIAALASAVVYADSIDDGRTGLLFRDPIEFQANLLRLIAMPELARGLGDAARNYVAGERMLAYQMAARTNWYRSLWNRREELERARTIRLRHRLAA